MSSTMSRRTFTAGAAGSLAAMFAGGALLPLTSKALAQGADLSSLGLPTLDLTVTKQAFEGLPATVAPGRYLVTATAGDGVDSAPVAFVSPGPGSTVDDLLMIMGGGAPEGSPAADGGAAASPEAGGGGEAQGAPPSFVYQAHFAGGVTAAAGQPGKVVVDLGPGDWILWGDDPSATQKPVTFTISGDMPADLAEPKADINVTFIDFGISVDGNLTAGDHVLHIENKGAQPHFLFLAKGPDSMTNDDIAAILTMEMGGPNASPAAMPFNPETDLKQVLATGTQSIGTVTWAPVSLDAGTYTGICFFPTAGEGLPHAFHGMHTVFKVS